ncbi:hypothetical protein J22TS1_09290 [Siminovitchia terrae]|uniref:hypothetical protein n=1 Tax=Siminovitchia terrae TaxID=1914933 RepID=UPI001B02AF33|nr:hypothetical protein [Siminovitchia terrae]GIN89878.1 hypothetical protein J22TS1_09290 [Siminovitchia terrae]
MGYTDSQDNLVSIEAQTEHSLTTGKSETRIFVKMYVDAVRSGLIADMGEDEMFGTYIDQRDEFLRDWESEEYSPTGSLVFKEEDVEVN